MDILSEMEATQPDRAYPLIEFLDDVREAVWGEPGSASAVNGYRRAPQRAYVERMEYRMAQQPAGGFPAPAPDLSRSDTRPLIRVQLVELRDDIAGAERRIRHRVSEAHLADLLVRIDAILAVQEG